MSAVTEEPEIALLDANVEKAIAALGDSPDEADVARLLDGSRRLVDALMSRREAGAAVAHLERVWSLSGLADHPIEKAILGFLSVRVLQAIGRHEAAVERGREVSTVIAASRGDGRGLGAPLQADLAQARAASLETLGRREEAREAQEEAVARRSGLVGRSDLPDQRPGLASARNALGRLHLQLGDADAAIAELTTCINELREVADDLEGKLPPSLFNTHAAACNRLGRALSAADRPFEAHPFLMSSVEGMRSLVNETRNLGLVDDFLTALHDLEAAERAMGNDAVASNLAAEAGRWRRHVEEQRRG